MSHENRPIDCNIDRLVCEIDNLSKLGRDQLSPGRYQAADIIKILNLIPYNVFIKNREGVFLYVNQAVADLYGLPTQEIIGFNQSKFQLNQDDLERMRADDLDVINRNIQKKVYDIKFVDCRGELHYINGIKIPITFGENSEPAVLGVSVDVTREELYRQQLVDINQQLEQKIEERVAELKMAEAKFTVFAESIPEVLYITDAKNNQVIYVSPAYEKIWGRPMLTIGTEASEWVKAIHPEDQETVRTEYYKSVASGNFSLEYRIIRGDGQIRWLADRAFPIKNENGEVIQIAGIARDITDLRNNELLIKRNERLSSLGTLAAGVAHELNNPVGAIMLAAQHGLSMLPKKNWPMTEKILQDIILDCRRAQKIVTGINKFTNNESTEKWPVEINLIVKEFVYSQRIRYLIGENINLILDLVDQQVLIKANPFEIEQLLINLIANSAQAQAANITIKSTYVDQTLRLTIIDDGCGLLLKNKIKYLTHFILRGLVQVVLV